MAIMASTLLRAARNASRAAAAAATRATSMASRSARAGAVAAAASHAAALASRSARAAGLAAAAARAARLDSGVIFPLKSCPTRDDSFTKPRDDALCRTSSCADYADYLSDGDGIIPMDKDLESVEAVWALYERWCKAFNKKRDHAEIARRFKLFKHHAQHVHKWNTYVPVDPKEAAIYRRKRSQIKLLLSKGKDISHIHEKYQPLVLYDNADGSDSFPSRYDEWVLKHIEESELSETLQ